MSSPAQGGGRTRHQGTDPTEGDRKVQGRPEHRAMLGDVRGLQEPRGGAPGTALEGGTGKAPREKGHPGRDPQVTSSLMKQTGSTTSVPGRSTSTRAGPTQVPYVLETQGSSLGWHGNRPGPGRAQSWSGVARGRSLPGPHTMPQAGPRRGNGHLATAPSLTLLPLDPYAAAPPRLPASAPSTPALAMPVPDYSWVQTPTHPPGASEKSPLTGCP